MRCGGIFRSADPYVMAADVLGVEVFVQNQPQHDSPHQAEVLLFAVYQLVGGNDAEARATRDDCNQQECVEGEKAHLGDQSRSQHDGGRPE